MRADTKALRRVKKTKYGNVKAKVRGTALSRRTEVELGAQQREFAHGHIMCEVSSKVSTEGQREFKRRNSDHKLRPRRRTCKAVEGKVAQRAMKSIHNNSNKKRDKSV